MAELWVTSPTLVPVAKLLGCVERAIEARKLRRFMRFLSYLKRR
jgi:hypothetical protein